MSIVILAEGASARNALGYRQEGRYVCHFRLQKYKIAKVKS